MALGRTLAARLATLVRWLAGVLPSLGPKSSDFPAPPLSFTDSDGREIAVREAGETDREGLVEMYDDFDPAQRAQGTPPLGEDAIRAWLDRLDEGENVVAVHNGRVVGHVSFVPDGTGRHELAIFVHQDYQRAGIGTRLVRAGLGHARDRGIDYVWLTVEAWKRGAQKLYSDAGFSTVNPMGAAHRMSRYL
jgi:ribosomal protein S18 acetylase RimI-like enzyme